MDNSKKLPQYVGTDIILTKKQNKKLKDLVKYVKENSNIVCEKQMYTFAYSKWGGGIKYLSFFVVGKELKKSYERFDNSFSSLR